jgi:hypothetical protein
MPGGLSRTPSQTSTPKKRNLSELGSSPIDSPPAKRQKTTNDAASSPTLPRSRTNRDLARHRDNWKIFGLRHIFWNQLRVFWPEETVAAWTAELFPQGINEMGVETVYNLITLSKTAHGYWNRGAFALKPISINEDKTTLKIQFFWQKKQNTQATMSLLTMPFSTKDLNQNEGAFEHGVTRLSYDDKRIQSGDIFELKTDDAIARPLPSFQLLEMQWFLTRVVGMAGAAFPYGSEDWDEDSDGEISNLGLDEVGDDSLSLSDPMPDTPECQRKDNLFTKASEHSREEVEADGARVGGGD